jgi:predicted KAP-like P-loop ATPase
LELSKETGDDEPVSTSLARLRSALEAFLVRVAKSIEGQRKRERFLENSFSLVLTIIGDAQGKLATEQVSQIQAMMTTAQDTK